MYTLNNLQFCQLYLYKAEIKRQQKKTQDKTQGQNLMDYLPVWQNLRSG